MRAARAAFLLLAGLGLLVTACAPEDDDEADDVEAVDVDPEDVEGAEIAFVGWEGYDGSPADDFSSLHAWLDEHDISLSSTYVSSNEEMLTGIQTAPAGTYDLTSPYHGTVPTMIAADAVQPIDVDQLPNWSEVYDFFREQDFARGPDGEIYAIPFTFSQSVAIYNADNAEPIDSFGRIFEDDELDGRFALLDAPEQLTWIADYLGYGNPDPHHLTPEELAEVGELAAEAVSKAQTLAPGYGDLLQLLIAGDVDYIWSATRDQVAAAQEEGVNADLFFAEGAAQTWVDSFSIPVDAENVDAAHAFINEALSPEVQAEFAAVYGGGVVNPDAVEHLDDELRGLYDYDQIESAFDRTPVLPPIPAESDEFATMDDWIETWNEAK